MSRKGQQMAPLPKRAASLSSRRIGGVTAREGRRARKMPWVFLLAVLDCWLLDLHQRPSALP